MYGIAQVYSENNVAMFVHSAILDVQLWEVKQSILYL